MDDLPGTSRMSRVVRSSGWRSAASAGKGLQTGRRRLEPGGRRGLRGKKRRERLTRLGRAWPRLPETIIDREHAGAHFKAEATQTMHCSKDCANLPAPSTRHQHQVVMPKLTIGSIEPDQGLDY